MPMPVCKKYYLLIIAFATTLLLSGCIDLTGQPSPLSKPPTPLAEKKHPLPGHVYTMRGFLGIFSRGMDTLATRCDHEVGIATLSIAAADWRQLASYIIAQKHQGKLSGPLILVGHSEGADNQIDVSYKLASENIPVDLLILIGPFAPAPVPSNVKHVLNLDRSFVLGKIIPFMGNVTVTVKDPTKTTMESLDIGYTAMKFNTNLINHFNIDKDPNVQNMVLGKIKDFVIANDA